MGQTLVYTQHKIRLWQRINKTYSALRRQLTTKEEETWKDLPLYSNPTNHTSLDTSRRRSSLQDHAT